MNSITANYYKARDVVPRGPQTDREEKLCEELAEALSRAEVAELEKGEAEERADDEKADAENLADELLEVQERALAAEAEVMSLRKELDAKAKRSRKAVKP